MMFTLFLILFVSVSFLLVVVILLQASKGDGLSGALGGGFMAQNVVGVRQAANFLQRATIILSVSFAVLAIIISLTIGGPGDGAKSILQERAAQTSNSQLPMLKPSSSQNQGNITPGAPADSTR